VFEKWKEPKEILQHVKLAIGTRFGFPDHDLGRYGDRVIPFQLESPPISSSEVRRRVAAGEAIDDLVPPAVARLIEELGLYR
jgi:nicotinic acid mononucleotide adenylyltransferase